MSALERVRQALTDHGCRGRGESWQCPAHEDRSPSLSVKQGKDGAVLYCHSGCPVEDVLAALGLTLADLFDRPREGGSGPFSDQWEGVMPQRSKVAVYNYLGADGTLLFTVERWEPGKNGRKKDFLRRSPEGKYSTAGIPEVLYNLPYVIATCRIGGTVYVVEGEKDVDACTARGICATCNPGGAGKWRDEFTAHLKGAGEVIVVQDKDEPGVAHAEQVAASVRSADIPVGIVEGKGEKDLTDHFAAGWGLDDLVIPDAEEAERLAEEQRRNRVESLKRAELEKREARRLADAEEIGSRIEPVRRTLVQELSLPDDEAEYSIDQLLPLGGNALFAGRYKSGKTVLNGNLIKAYADNEPFLGVYHVNSEKDKCVTIFNYEMSEGQFRRWLRKFGIKNPDRVQIVHLRGASLPLANPAMRERAAQWLTETNTGLWIIDPASRAMAGLGDGNSNSDVNAFTAYLDEIKAAAGVRDMVLNVHMGHAAAQDKDAERALGAQAWSAWADSLWTLTRDKDEIRYFKAYGRDVNVPESAIMYDQRTMTASLVEASRADMRNTAIGTAVYRVVEQNPGINARGIRDQAAALVDARLKDLDAARDRLVEEEVIAKIPAGREHRFYLAKDVPTLK